ncbi:unnamed protein product [Litomosoides sigmodontis]|uniref:Uncharacterized protein n=1 Tax=Litomosoides sigmodontis TaxID=42156 RepID=A0A3P6T106_LITSI|nr:unnamed protein product [Litomosoides sigmodontis]
MESQLHEQMIQVKARMEDVIHQRINFTSLSAQDETSGREMDERSYGKNAVAANNGGTNRFVAYFKAFRGT